MICSTLQRSSLVQVVVLVGEGLQAGLPSISRAPHCPVSGLSGSRRDLLLPELGWEKCWVCSGERAEETAAQWQLGER